MTTRDDSPGNISPSDDVNFRIAMVMIDSIITGAMVRESLKLAADALSVAWGPEPGGMSSYVWSRPSAGRDRRGERVLGERVLGIRGRLADHTPTLHDLPAALSSEHRLRVSKWNWRILR